MAIEASLVLKPRGGAESATPPPIREEARRSTAVLSSCASRLEPTCLGNLVVCFENSACLVFLTDGAGGSEIAVPSVL
ncbi:unnamed protein product [Linum trigynum]|uniref:Uncharacterized protein n=1 Tax=Linum trigynum TaxID=586398 RepID=A0AAV2ET87_9ROSI